MNLDRRTFLSSACGLVLAAVLPRIALPADQAGRSRSFDRLVVHEWGTFTVLQDEDGNAIGGINTDDELLPEFVHDIAGITPSSLSELPPVYFKAIPRTHPDVYVRLETPVTYFYPPAGFDKPIDVKVSFRQGWLTQFYPDAAPGGPDVNEAGRLRWGRLTPRSHGSLEWKRLRLHGQEPGPDTDHKTWTAPRKVTATSVHTPAGERERYLFYRGVGNLTAPVKVVRTTNNEFQIRADWPLRIDATIGPLVLFDARADGTCAYRTVDRIDMTKGEDRVLAKLPSAFPKEKYSAENLGAVRQILHAALLRDGLFEEEATAMLDTWEVSYFKRPGLRLFFMVPRPWTEHYLPLAVSESADITRAMIGRIELVTPEQRGILNQIAAGPVSDAKWALACRDAVSDSPRDYYREEWFQDVLEGRRSLLDCMNVTAPQDYKAYLSLGRFRNPLILDHARRAPTENLNKFIRNYHLDSYDIAE